MQDKRKGTTEDTPTKKRLLIICLLLIIAAFMAFWQVTHCEFTNYDDPEYVTKNSHIQGGLTMEEIGWAFVTTRAGNWHPLTWISHMLDVQLFGLAPGLASSHQSSHPHCQRRYCYLSCFTG